MFGTPLRSEVKVISSGLTAAKTKHDESFTRKRNNQNPLFRSLCYSIPIDIFPPFTLWLTSLSDKNVNISLQGKCDNGKFIFYVQLGVKNRMKYLFMQNSKGFFPPPSLPTRFSPILMWNFDLNTISLFCQGPSKQYNALDLKICFRSAFVHCSKWQIKHCRSCSSFLLWKYWTWNFQDFFFSSPSRPFIAQAEWGKVLKMASVIETQLKKWQ